MKYRILDNVDQYTARQLADYIKQGVITIDELIHESDESFNPTVRAEVQNLLENGEEQDWEETKELNTIEGFKNYLKNYSTGKYREQAHVQLQVLMDQRKQRAVEEEIDLVWYNLNKENINEVRTFLSDYPNCKFTQEATSLYNKLLKDDLFEINISTLVEEIKQIKDNEKKIVDGKLYRPELVDSETISLIETYLSEKKVNKIDFLEYLKKDNNIIRASMARMLLDKGVIDPYDLINIAGIDKRFIKQLYQPNAGQNRITSNRKLEYINKPSTEIYFWGTPSSGKSCALGAILSAANKARVVRRLDPDPASQGYSYLSELVNMFQENKVIQLMQSTAIDQFYEMGFDLIDHNNNIYPITCIDMAGELMRCMHKFYADRSSLTDKENEMLETMHKVLTNNSPIDHKNSNRKIHVFVIEYGAENKLFEGLMPKIYLDGVIAYIKLTEIFKHNTDSIFILITKADKAQDKSPQHLKEYIEEHYLSFYNGLEQICVENDINNGKVDRLAFSVGQVCFESYCLFDPKPAENVIKTILSRTASTKGGKIGKILNFFKS